MQTAQPNCDLVFDVQSEIGQKILSKWQVLRDYEPNEDRKKMMASPPMFGDDRTFLPLQAADMYAWLVRDQVERSLLDELRPKIKSVAKSRKRITIGAVVKQIREIENISREYSFDALMRIAAKMMVVRAKELRLLD